MKQTIILILNNTLQLNRVIFSIVCIFIFLSCDKNEVPETNTGTIKDIEGNVYKTVKIGNQWWMAENLKTSRFQNGDPILNVSDNTQWSKLIGSAYCNYENNDSNAKIYGHLYNWYAVNDPRNICPTGWHIPSDAEWSTLISFLGGADIAGNRLKEVGTLHWNSPNEGATNESGFSALPGGNRRSVRGEFNAIGTLGLWWTSSKSDPENTAWYRYIGNLGSTVYRFDGNLEYGFSVRCVRDMN